jgi:tRNA G18 (ribose-2'-O)-methylase SpoU
LNKILLHYFIFNFFFNKAFVHLNENKIQVKANNLVPLSVVLDKVKDPGNMGTIIRTAVAVGFRNVFITKESAHVWSPKVLRSAMGAHFHIKIVNEIDNSSNNKLEEYFKSKQVVMCYADSKQKPESMCYTKLGKNIQLSKVNHVCLVIGNETKGVSEWVFKFGQEFEQKFVVKVPSAVESLNCSIAFAVIAYELRRLFKV